MSASHASMARYFDRDPITASYPIVARRAANALPAGPVPPRIPMRICASLHTDPRVPPGTTPEGGGTSVRTMGLLEGKNIVVTGVLTDASLAFGVAALAQREGAKV